MLDVAAGYRIAIVSHKVLNQIRSELYCLSKKENNKSGVTK